MKTTQLFLSAALLITCFCFAQCKKNIISTTDNPYGLPNATQTGVGIFACLINGQKFIAGPFYDVNPYLNRAGFYGDTLGISGEPKKGTYFQGIAFQVHGNLHQGQVFSIDSINTIAVLQTDSTCLGISSNIVTSYSKIGILQLTKLDTVNRIVSGTFSCDFPILNCDTLHVTDGRFDYNYY